MKNILSFVIAALICLSSKGQTDRLTGAWLGNINAGTTLRLVLHFTIDTNGKFAATLDSPDQGAKGIRCSAVVVNADSVRVEVDVAKAVYRARIINDTTINGTWNQMTASTTLNLKKVSQIAALNRPQTPKPKYAYGVEDVEYDNADKSVHFGGTFTYPKGGGKFAVALLITGSGQQDRDETIFEHKPFLVLADYLTKNGIAVLRVDDRGIGKSTGDMMTATSADFAMDVQAGINYLKSRPEVDQKKIGLIGHSEGGMIAPMVAANNKDISFIVLWGAAIVGGPEINTEQNGYALQRAGINNASVNSFKQLHRKELELFKTTAEASFRLRVKEVFDQWRQQQPDSVLKALYVTDSSIVGKNIFTMYNSLNSNVWMKYFLTHDFAGDLAKVKCKVLAINGELDTQVDATSNLQAIDSILKKNNHHSYKTVQLKGLNHLLQTAITGDDREYGQIEETIAPEVLKLMATWINENVNNKH